MTLASDIPMSDSLPMSKHSCESHINICDIHESIIVHIFGQRRVPATKHKDFQTLVRYYIRQKTFNLWVVLEPVKRQVIAFFAIAFIPEDIATYKEPGA
jgi:hypothetical protein